MSYFIKPGLWDFKRKAPKEWLNLNQVIQEVAGGGGGGSPDWGNIGGTLSDQTDLQSALDDKASLSGATFSGKVNFTADGTNPGINIGSHTANPSGRTNYDLWFETNNNRFMFRRGATDYVVSHFAVGDIGAGRIPILTSDGTGRFNTNSNLTFSSSTLNAPSLSVSGEVREIATAGTITTVLSNRNNKITTSDSSITFTITFTGFELNLEIILNNTACTLTFPANSLCRSEGSASGDNTCALTGTSGDKYLINIKSVNGTYYVDAKNFGQ